MRAVPPPATVQAAYYAGGATWPLVSYPSFELVTGRKREPWLVKTVSLLMLAIAGALAADPRGESAVTRRLGIGSAIAFGAIDLWYAGIRRRISGVYLLDAVAQGLLVALWIRPRGPGVTTMGRGRG